ncbi:hypothetical protein D046_2155B, partial [Vibrio parahaemolyticus V-223/04]
CKMQHGA